MTVVTADPNTDVTDHTWDKTFLVINNLSPTIGTVEDQSLLAPDPHSWTFLSSLTNDPEGLNYVKSIKFNGTTTIPTWLNYDLTDFSFWLVSSSNAYSGNHTITLIVTDDYNPAVSKDFNLEIILNSAPQKNKVIQDYSIVNYNLLTIPFEDIYTLFTDPDGRDLTPLVTQANGNSLPSFLTYNSVNNSLYGTPSDIHVGDWLINYNAVDDHNLTGAITFKISVKRIYFDNF
jgi:large repetitive protein